MTGIDASHDGKLPARVFAATSNETKALGMQKLLRFGFLAVTLLLLIPAAGILGVLVVEGAPGLTWEFLTTKPTNNGASGGIATALVLVTTPVLAIAAGASTSPIASMPRLAIPCSTNRSTSFRLWDDRAISVDPNSGGDEDLVAPDHR